MPSKLADDSLSKSVLEFVTEGKFPESEKVVSAEFSSSALPEALQHISKAREQAQKEISSLSEQTALDVDGWITQAKQLHADIERSKITAREIVAQHEKTRPLNLRIEDTVGKVKLLKTEIAFNETLTETLQSVRYLCQRLNVGQSALEDGNLAEAIESLEMVERSVKAAGFHKDSNLTSIILESASVLRGSIIEDLRHRWSSSVKISRSDCQLQVEDSQDTPLDQTIQFLSHLGVLDSAISAFERDLQSLFINPVLRPLAFGKRNTALTGDFGVRIEKDPQDNSAFDVICELEAVLGYLHQKLPPSISQQLSKAIVPRLSTSLVKNWLSPAIPTELAGLNDFENLLKRVIKFCDTLEGFGWHEQGELLSWTNQVARHWLTRRRIDSLDQVRRLLISSKGSTKSVERVEKELVSNQSDVLLGADSEDWDANWENEDDAEDKEEDTTAIQTSAEGLAEGEEDVSAWGLDDVEAEVEKTADAPIRAEDNEDAEDAEDAWGWGDEDEQQASEIGQKNDTPDSAPKAQNGHPSSQNPKPREITLTEHYTVTDVPDSLIDLIEKQISDSETIKLPEYSNSRVSQSGTGLLTLPTLILAMFKATAPSFYSMKLSSGQMYLYNDCMYLADRIRDIVEKKQLSRLTPDIDSLEKFGKASYSKEMQTQRTIATDLLDGVQGFANCSEQPFLGECENAINATVDRIRNVYKEWHSILSHSALLQAIGSLLSTVIDKVIIDIEDLSDISEAESQRLVSFCNTLSKLEDIFMPEPKGEGEIVSMAAVYVTSWLKFQYLINILESSLADIKFLWAEGELPLEFSPEEVIDLVEALFAESEHRRKAIAEIRRTARR